MAEAEAADNQAAAPNGDGAGTPGEPGPAAAEAGAGEAAPAPPPPAGPGLASRVLGGLFRWHPFIFLGIALAMAVYAWQVYPKPREEQVPPADTFYSDGLDRLYRVLNPDLPLIADSPSDEALAARNSFLNLFVFHRAELRNYPQFVNPHLLLAEANRILAESTPAMAEKYYADAAAAYADAALWERREDSPEKLAVYIVNNYLDGVAAPDAGSIARFFEDNADEIALRRARRDEYIAYRRAEADVNLRRPELARAPLEEIQARIDAKRREELRSSIAGDFRGGEPPRRVFELGPDDYRNLDLLLAKAYDGLEMLDRARSWYLRYLSEVPEGRNQAFVVGRLAAIYMGDGEVYRRASPERASAAFEAARGYYQALADSGSATREQLDAAALGLAAAYSRLASLVPAGEATGVDELNRLGRTLAGWLEEFSGQPLPRRTLAAPRAIGQTLAKPELLLPGPRPLAGAAGGGVLDMAGGGLATPGERRRLYLARAMETYDGIARLRAGTEAGDRALVMAARESWGLGLKAETEARFEKMIDPLSRPELVLAARLGLAVAALDRGDARRAHLLILGGFMHPAPLWLAPADADWRRIAVRLGNAGNRAAPGPWLRIWETLPDEGRETAGYAASGRRLDDEYVNRFLRALNTMLRRDDFYAAEYFPAPENRNFYLNYLLARPPELLTPDDMVWRNRLLLEEAWPYDLAQRAGRGVLGFEPFPGARDLQPGGLVEPERVRELLADLARAWIAGAAGRPVAERLRMTLESVEAYRTVLDRYGGDPGEILFELARNYETLADIRESQGRRLDALSLTAEAGRNYLDVSFRAMGAPREMDALLAAGDAFFRAGLLERTVESQKRLQERFGYSSLPGSESAMAVVRSENLLGRAHWFLGDTKNALESFKRNIPRRTPDRFKSIYYIGRVLMDEGVAKNDPALLGDAADPLPNLDRNTDPIIETALQAFNWLRQSPGINPTARAWRWSAFDLARLQYVFAERARKDWEEKRARAAANPPPAPPAGAAPAEAGEARPWLALYDEARARLTEVLERYPLRRNGGSGLSVTVEPADYADVMTARFEAESDLAGALLVLAGARRDESLASLARAHLENLRDRNRYAAALFDTALDRFQLNAAVVREELGNAGPLERSRLGDDEGPTHSPQRLKSKLRNAMLTLADEYYRAGDTADRPARRPDGAADSAAAGVAAGFYRRSYEVYQDVYDRFGVEYGAQAMVGMGDALSRLGRRDDAANHYRMARNIAGMQPPDTRSDGLLAIGPAFWGGVAESRLRDLAGGYNVP